MCTYRAARPADLVHLPQAPAERHRRGRPEGLAALHGWLATTTRRECGRVPRAARKPEGAGYVLDAQNIPDEQTGIAEHEPIIAEPNSLVHEAFTHPPQTASGKPPCSPNTLPRPTSRSAPA